MLHPSVAVGVGTPSASFYTNLMGAHEPKQLGLLPDIWRPVLNGFALGTVDISRCNFGEISLIPKCKGAESIKQFRPIALINVPFKLCAKVFASCLSPIGHRVINKCQSAFIKGRNILEGPLALVEIIHEIKIKKQSAILLKLDFEKAYDQVNWEFLRKVLLTKGFEAGWVYHNM